MANEVQNVIVPALDRALDIIEYLAERTTESVSIKQVSLDLDIPLTSTFRIMKNFAARGYVEEIQNGSLRFTLGYRLLSLAAKCERNLSIQSVAQPIMRNLASKVRQTVQLAVWKQSQTIYIDQVLSSASLNMISPLYEPVDINTSASAKVLLTRLSPEERENALNRCAFSRRTDYSIVSRAEFEDELLRCRDLGYGVDNEEFSIGVGCLAVPVYDARGKCVAALGITGQIGDYRDDQRFEEMHGELSMASRSITFAIS